MRLSKVDLNELLKELELAVNGGVPASEIEVQVIAETAWWKASLLKVEQSNDDSKRGLSIDRATLIEYIAYLDTKERELRPGYRTDIEHFDSWLAQHPTDVRKQLTDLYLQRKITRSKRQKHLEQVKKAELREQAKRDKKRNVERRPKKLSYKPPIEIIFECEGFNCKQRHTLSKELEKNGGFPVIICQKCGTLLELEQGGTFGGGGGLSYKRSRFQVSTLGAFRSSTIPPEIVEAIKEAITCYANKSYYACVAMCRRIIEGIVVIMNAKGRNLKEKINYLGNKNLICSTIIVPNEHRIRSLGNIACHFDTIRENDITEFHARACLAIAYEITKDVLAGVKIDSQRLHDQYHISLNKPDGDWFNDQSDYFIHWRKR